MNKKILSLILCLALAVSLIMPGITVKAAENEDSSATSGLNINKTAVANGDGSYTITLEAYATGSKVITEVKEDVPTDIILVLDQSGSMEENMGSTTSYSFKPYPYKQSNYTTYGITNEELYDWRHNGNGDNGNLWYPLSDGSYAQVSVTLEVTAEYKELSSTTTNNQYAYKEENLYAKVNGEYVKVSVDSYFDYESYSYIYVYTLSDGTEIARSTGWNGTPNYFNTDGGILYESVTDDEKSIYTYTYTDDAGIHTIGTSTGANTKFTEETLYRRISTTSNSSKLDALKTAVTGFVNAVNAKAAGADGDITKTEDNVNHRIAVVGFASESGYGNNTELLSISGTNSGNVGVAYNDISTENYKAVLQNMDTAAGQTMVDNAIDALATNGATRADLGMEMARNILENNPVEAGNPRNQVVIMFTDGSPTSSNGFETNVANSAISTSDTIKETYGATVYSIGIFSGADATSAGSSTGNTTQKCNWFMQKVSSNDGTPQTPSYYLSAKDAETLNSIFRQISDNIESGGSTTTLDSSAVIKDIVAPSFTLPGGTNADAISIKSYPCTDVEKNNDGTSTYTFRATANDAAKDASVTVNGGQVDVTGFDFAGNYCGVNTDENHKETIVGSKLVISFTVKPKAGFLGGNGVFTNTSAGVYENAEAETPILQFNRPQVDVAIDAVTVTAPDKNVYLLADVTAADLKAGATIKCGDVTLNPSEENFGLEAWQNEYVNITVTYTDKDGNTLTDLNDLTDDTTYTVSVTVSPKTKEGAATAKIGSAIGNINVYKPTITYRDSVIDPGTTPDYETHNYVSTEWFHNQTEAVAENMTGDAPDLSYTYDPAEKPLNEETYVNVTVKIGETSVDDHVTFAHKDCDLDLPEPCTFDNEKGEFLIHMNSFDLVIQKIVDKDDLANDLGQTFIFNITGPNGYKQQVVLRGNDEITLTKLPVGNYTVTEDTSWSWRYEVQGDASVTITSANIHKGEAEASFTNKRTDDSWLDGNTFATNIFGQKSTDNG